MARDVHSETMVAWRNEQPKQPEYAITHEARKNIKKHELKGYLKYTHLTTVLGNFHGIFSYIFL